VVRRAGEADEDTAKPVGWDGDGHLAGRSDHVLQAERLCRLGPAQRFERAKYDTGPQGAGHDSDQRGAARPQAEAVQPEQATDPEHGDEAEQNRRRGHATEVEAKVNDVQEAAEDVVEDERQQEKAAADKQAAPEYEISRAQAPSIS